MITPNHLSILGIIHTIISVLALLAAFYALFREGKLDPATGNGKLYILLTVITCLTGLPIMKTGHLTAAHYVAIIILVFLPIAIYIRSLRIFGRLADYVQVILMSVTLFLSCVPAIVETLTRLPVSQPIAAGPDAPILQNCLAILFVLFLLGVTYQLITLKKRKKAAQSPKIKFS